MSGIQSHTIHWNKPWVKHQWCLRLWVGSQGFFSSWEMRSIATDWEKKGFFCQACEFYKHINYNRSPLHMDVKRDFKFKAACKQVFSCLIIWRHLVLTSGLFSSAMSELGDLARDSILEFQLKSPLHCTFLSSRLDFSEYNRRQH